MTWRPIGRSAAVAAAIAAAVLGTQAMAQQESVLGTVHNLSVSGPGEVRSLTETQVCKFCHIPHNAEVPVPLWGHALSEAQYQTPDIRVGDAREPAPQPDGASRLCLSCHDGTVALGDITSEPRAIAMVGGDRLRPGRPGYIGTDLSGSHPVSFVVPDGLQGTEEPESDMTLRPLSAIEADADVVLDGAGKMQCTTCHDPHADRYYEAGRVPRFWVKPTVEEVCLTCHALR
jgi:hypothetical protein